MTQFYCNICSYSLHFSLDRNNTASETSTSNAPKSYVTSCKHVFCRNCKGAYQDHCPVCKQQCKIIEICNTMPSIIRLFFEPIEYSFELISEVTEFQETQLNVQEKKVHHLDDFYTQKYAQEMNDLKMIERKFAEKLETQKKMECLLKIYEEKARFAFSVAIVLKFIKWLLKCFSRQAQIQKYEKRVQRPSQQRLEQNVHKMNWRRHVTSLPEQQQDAPFHFRPQSDPNLKRSSVFDSVFRQLWVFIQLKKRLNRFNLSALHGPVNKYSKQSSS